MAWFSNGWLVSVGVFGAACMLIGSQRGDPVRDRIVMNDERTGAELVLGTSPLPDGKRFFGLQVSHEKRRLAVGVCLDGGEGPGLYLYDGENHRLLRLGRNGRDVGLWIYDRTGRNRRCFVGRTGDDLAVMELGSGKLGIRLVSSQAKKKCRIELNRGEQRLGIHAAMDACGFFLKESERLRIFSGFAGKGYGVCVYGPEGSERPFVTLSSAAGPTYGLTLFDRDRPKQRFVLGYKGGGMVIKAFDENGVDVIKDFLR